MRRGWRQPDRAWWAERKRAWRTELELARHDRRTALTLGALALLALGSCGAGAVSAAWTRACAGGCPSASQMEDFAPRQATVLYDEAGGVVGMFFRERRQVVPLGSLPPMIPMAFVAIEDRRFFDHEGVDVWRILAAVRDNVFEGFGASGASTISMQLARNLFPEQLPPGEKSLRRKIAEARLALLMERRFTKEEILQLYLNHIYLGAGAYGIEAAARTYFDKTAAEMKLEEAALLAGLPQAPSAYNPRRNPEDARRRRNLVLSAMADAEVISRGEAEAAQRKPLLLAPPSGVMDAPYFVEHIRRELEDQFGELLYTGGLKIHTTLDPKLQKAAEMALEEHLKEVESGNYGWFRHPTYAEYSESLAADGTGPGNTPYLQGVVVSLDPHTGDVLAMVGGRDFRHSQFNRATQALRQPGSAFKPFVYAAALEAGRSPLYNVSDQPIHIPQVDGTVWSPRNYSGDYEGDLTLRQALRNSKNMVAIRLGEEVGIEAVRSVARRTGIDTDIPAYPSVYIGSAGVYPLDLIAAYAPFANGGMRVTPRFIKRIEDHEGNLLWEPVQFPRPALDPAVSWILTDMLREVVDQGTGYNARNPAVGNLPYTIPAAGKTGTTNGNTDVWFVGYTPDVLTGVWLGLDRPRTITSGATGGGFAVPVWARVVRTYYEDHPEPAPWERPPGVVIRHFSRWTGTPVAEDCPYIVGATADFFVASAAPEPRCDNPSLSNDPQPWLPGRPVFPGQPRVPQMRDYVDSTSRSRGGDPRR